MNIDSTEEISRQTQQRIHQLLDRQGLGVLATRDGDGHPYASLIAFAADEDHSQIYFITPEATRKHANLIQDPRVALLVNDCVNSPSDFHDAIAVTILGEARVVEDREKQSILRVYLKKHAHLHQFAHAPSCALFALRVTGFTMVQQFQNVSDLRFDHPLDADR